MNKEFWKAMGIAYIITFLASLLFNIWLFKESFEFTLFLRAVFDVICVGIGSLLALVFLAVIFLVLLELLSFQKNCQKTGVLI